MVATCIFARAMLCYMEMRIIVNDNYGNLWYYCRLNIFIIHVASSLRIICETWNEGKIYVRN